MYYYSKAICDNNTYAPLAKLDIASVYGTEGQGFESLTACHKNTNHFLWLVFLFARKGFELGASNFSCVFADRRKNSPVDCFAGGSREANPLRRAIKKGYRKMVSFFVLYCKYFRGPFIRLSRDG